MFVLLDLSPLTRRQNLPIGLSRTADLTFTIARRANHFLSRRMSITLSRGHELQCEFSIETKTTSPMAKFLLGGKPLCLLRSKRRYSLDHRFQKISAGHSPSAT